eukprot:3487705-Alexandrium_andersonii.AAC.1
MNFCPHGPSKLVRPVHARRPTWMERRAKRHGGMHHQPTERTGKTVKADRCSPTAFPFAPSNLGGHA